MMLGIWIICSGHPSYALNEIPCTSIQSTGKKEVQLIHRKLLRPKTSAKTQCVAYLCPWIFHFCYSQTDHNFGNCTINLEHDIKVCTAPCWSISLYPLMLLGQNKERFFFQSIKK